MMAAVNIRTLVQVSYGQKSRRHHTELSGRADGLARGVSLVAVLRPALLCNRAVRLRAKSYLAVLSALQINYLVIV
jgi:hypothetical protein